MRQARPFVRLTGLILLAGGLGLAVRAAHADNWPRFRGDNGSAVGKEDGLNAPWNPDRVRWTVPVPGTGHSSPVIWGNKLFLTTASETGTTRSVLCFDAQTGKQLWIRSIQLNANPKHPKSSWASATPAVDGERVYVAFADVERTCSRPTTSTAINFGRKTSVSSRANTGKAPHPFCLGTW